MTTDITAISEIALGTLADLYLSSFKVCHLKIRAFVSLHGTLL